MANFFSKLFGRKATVGYQPKGIEHLADLPSTPLTPEKVAKAMGPVISIMENATIEMTKSHLVLIEMYIGKNDPKPYCTAYAVGIYDSVYFVPAGTNQVFVAKQSEFGRLHGVRDFVVKTKFLNEEGSDFLGLSLHYDRQTDVLSANTFAEYKSDKAIKVIKDFKGGDPHEALEFAENYCK